MIEGIIKTLETQLPNKKLAKLTPVEDKAWTKAFNYWSMESFDPDEADERAWIAVQNEFPRLKDFDGCEAKHIDVVNHNPVSGTWHVEIEGTFTYVMAHDGLDSNDKEFSKDDTLKIIKKKTLEDIGFDITNIKTEFEEDK